MLKFKIKKDISLTNHIRTKYNLCDEMLLDALH